MTNIFVSEKDSKRNVLRSVKGDCLEGVGLRIPHGGQAVIRAGLDIRVGDLVHCSKLPGACGGFIKQVKDITDGVYTVGTAYLDPSRDFTFEAADIYGVVTEVFDSLWGTRVYCRP